MSSDSELLRNIFEVTRGDLESCHFPIPNIQHLLLEISFLRISGLSDFWVPVDGNAIASVHQLTENFLGGLYAQQCPYLFLVVGEPPYVQFWVGIPNRFFERKDLEMILRAAFPDILVNKNVNFNINILGQLKHALVLSGSPVSKLTKKVGRTEDQIEQLCRGLVGRKWIYIVDAQPLAPVEILRLTNELSVHIREVQNKYLLRNSPTDQENRLAKTYISLLEAQFNRIDSGRRNGMWSVQAMLFTENPGALRISSGLLSSAYSGKSTAPQPFRVRLCTDTVSKPPTLDPLNTSELATLVRLPQDEYPGYKLFEHISFGVDVPLESGQGGKLVRIGDVLDRGSCNGVKLNIPIVEFTKHAFIVGVTGSGKTNTCFSLLEQFWEDGKGIPFLIIEPAKSEYRQLLRSQKFAKDLNIFTIADETVSPIRLNPLWVPKGILIQSHIDFIKALFGAAFVLYPPMPYVLEQALQEIYVDRGWNLAINVNLRGDEILPRMYPTLSDLVAKIEEVVERMGYDERLMMDIKAGLQARINQLCHGGGKGLMLDTQNMISLDVLFTKPCILELKQLVSDEEKAFIIGLILIFLYEFNESKGLKNSQKISHITVIEEAHRLLKNTSTEQGSEVYANPRGHAIDVFTNMLAEIRAYGEGMIIAEQIPTKLAPEVLKNTNLKIVHRIVAEDDRNIVGASMTMNDSQKRSIATLKTGDAIIYAEHLHKPILVRTPLSPHKISETPITSTELAEYMTAGRFHNKFLWLNFPQCESCSLEEHRMAKCRGGLAKDLDSELNLSFKRLFNAIRLSNTHVWEMFSEFKQICQRLQSGQNDASYCVFVRCLNHELDARGIFGGWKFEDIEKAFTIACVGIRHIAIGHGKEERNSIEKKAAPDLQLFRNLMERMHKVKVRPFTGCESCLNECAYRFDMSILNQEFTDLQHSKDIYNNPSPSLSEIARFCWNYSSRFFSTKDIRSRRGASFCFGVQQFENFKIEPMTQLELAHRLLDKLEKLE